MTKNTPKRGKGRPPKSAAEKMSELLTIKMTPAQMAEIDSAPVPNVRAWCRDVLLRAVARLKKVHR